jgi:hypothetical protein
LGKFSTTKQLFTLGSSSENDKGSPNVGLLFNILSNFLNILSRGGLGLSLSPKVGLGLRLALFTK